MDTALSLWRFWQNFPLNPVQTVFLLGLQIDAVQRNDQYQRINFFLQVRNKRSTIGVSRIINR